MKKFYSVELKDGNKLKAFLKENQIYYECSAIDNWGFHFEILCDGADKTMINEFLEGC